MCASINILGGQSRPIVRLYGVRVVKYCVEYDAIDVGQGQFESGRRYLDLAFLPLSSRRQVSSGLVMTVSRIRVSFDLTMLRYR